MFKNILVPIALDGEHSPEAALKAARALAGEGARVTLLHVMPDVPGYAISYMPEGYDIELKRSIQAELDRLAADFPEGAGVIRNGHASQEILDWIDENPTDCIIVASHQPGLQDYLLGSTASRVVRHAPCSVMVLR